MQNCTNGFTVWLTGIPCSGKSTISERLARILRAGGRRVELLDGDIIRRHLSSELGFSREDRDLNVQRIGFVSQLLSRNGVIVIVAAVSPYERARRQVREQAVGFVEVHVNCSVAVCEQRDVKGMYALARAGKIVKFTGLDDPYEPPVRPEVVCHTESESIEESSAKIVAALHDLGLLPRSVDRDSVAISPNVGSAPRVSTTSA